MKKMIGILSLLLVVSAALFPQAVGDYGSAASGNWGTAGTWVVCVTGSTWDGATAAASAPNNTKNVWVRNGHTVTLESSGKTCLNLTIDSGGTLSTGQPTTTNRYVRVYGSALTVNGTFGGDADGLGLEPFASMTITGSGTFRPCRMRPGTSISNITVTFDINTTFTYTGSTGTGGAGLYALNSGNDNITFVLNAGKTMTAVNYCNIATSSSTSVDAAASTVFTINGTLSLPGPNSNFSLRTASGKTCDVTINGLVVVGNNFLPTSFTTANSATITVNAGGELKVGAGGAGTCDVDSAIVNGAGTFTLMSGSTITVGSVSGLEPVAGSIRTATRNFSSGAKYSFAGTAAQVTGSDLPSVVASVTVNNAAGVTLSNTVSVDTSLTLTNGKLITGANAVIAKGAVNSAGAGRFVEGNLTIPVSTAAVRSWAVGQNSDYLPFVAGFSSVTGSDNVTVKALDKNTAAPSGTYSGADKVLRRFFRVVKGAGISSFTTDSVVLSYTNADAAEQGVADENTLRVYKHDGAALSAVTVAGRDTAANTITVTGVNSFSDFIITGAEIVPSSGGSVTFQVNMKVQSRIKKFDPAKDTVIVRGDFYQGAGNWWEANDLKLTDGDNDSIYTGTFNVGTVPKRLGKYKFVKRGPSFAGDVWEINMGPNNDRTDTVPSSPWTLPVVWFDYDSTSNQIMVPPSLPIDFEASNVEYTFENFSGATTTRVPNTVKGTIDSSGFVGKTVKGVGDPWAGSYMTLGAPVDLTQGKIFKVKVYMPKVGAKMLFKLEHLTVGSINKEIDITATKANEWEELTYDFSSVHDTTKFQKVVIIFDLGTSGDGGANFTYYFDDIRQIKPVPVYQDPKMMTAFSSKNVVTVDGKLDEPIWQAAVPFLVFGPPAFHSDPLAWSVTGGAEVKPSPNHDVSYTQLKFARRGPHFFIGFRSKDQSVSRFGDSWEGDGIFMKIKNAKGVDKEFKLYYNLPGNSAMHYEASDSSHGFGVGVKHSSTIVNDTTQVDSGYTAELVIKLDSLGFTSYDSVRVLINVFDPDGYPGTGTPWGAYGSFHKSWWGSEWGPEMRVVKFTADSSLTGVAAAAIPEGYALEQNYPNPFNPSTNIAFSTMTEGWVSLKVFNVVGQEVATLVNRHVAAGKHIASFNAEKLTSGVYFYKLQAGTFTSIKKMMLLK